MAHYMHRVWAYELKYSLNTVSESEKGDSKTLHKCYS